MFNITNLYSSSILAVDGYKITMALAGSPLCRETFYLSFRRGGPYYVPFALKEWMRSLIEDFSWNDTHESFLKENFHSLTSSMSHVLKTAREQSSSYEMSCVPEGQWFCAGEPIITFTGPSFLDSWLETQTIWLQYPIQLATQLKKGLREIVVVSEDQDRIAQFVARSMGLMGSVTIRYDEKYESRVETVVQDIISVVEDPNRIVEGGMRSAVSPEHHKIVLSVMKKYGIMKTSNMQAAMELGMTPGGTVGHEHTQRVGSDLRAYRNSVERVPGLSGCLLDTWSTINSGMPAAIEIAKLYSERQFVSRFDSGNKEAFFLLYVDLLKRESVENQMINIAGDVGASTITRFEKLREIADWPMKRLSYMVGGKATCETLPIDYNRNSASAVYKLSKSGGKPVMKFGDDFCGAKKSWPGIPVIWRKTQMQDGPTGFVAQAGEEINLRGYKKLEDLQSFDRTSVKKLFESSPQEHTVEASPATKKLIQELSR